ncbi:gamma-glutamylcyclotransferase [Salipaludibacillus daqingensis]|uniref:gamma-glutamylcyclotransferase n=1 Tax=Salipaludibacillus daqingensis TaxID=3041001 RepID=UPI00247436B2|nr:gamma-glutamylcyclotransferase [Salipaludibacillus daqingensis]
MNNREDYVFVYGTLRKNQTNHALLKNAVLISEQAKIIGGLYDTGHGYPALLLNDNLNVFGEIYQVNKETLNSLDVLEGYEEGRESNLYYRCKKEVTTDEDTYTCWGYVLDERHEKSLGEAIPFQDWNVHQWFKSFTHVYYFAYGSCMDTERIEKAGMIEHFSKEVKIGKLDGYRFAYSFPQPDGARADIIETNSNEFVEGIVYSLPKEAINYLFQREGVYSHNYRPTFVNVDINGELVEQVLTFTVIDKKPSTAPPEHYATEILRGAQGRVSTEYFQKLNRQLFDLGYKF